MEDGPLNFKLSDDCFVVVVVLVVVLVLEIEVETFMLVVAIIPSNVCAYVNVTNGRSYGTENFNLDTLIRKVNTSR